MRKAATVAAIFGLHGCTGGGLPRGATLQAHELYGVWAVFFWTAVFVAAVVYGLIAWCLLRYRRPDDEPAAQWKQNNAWEIVTWIVPLLMVGGLFALTYAAERHVERVAAGPGLRVNVTGFRWSWRFAYPALGVVVNGAPSRAPELVLPLGQTVEFHVTSADVDHSFWVPAFLFKRDAVPGMDNVFDWTPSRLGTYRGECGEFCGLEHAFMTFSVRVVGPADFRAWVAQRHGSALVGVASGAVRSR